MSATKLSVSVDAELATFIEHYRDRHGVKSRSEVVERALELLQEADLAEQYEAAYREWTESGEAELWDQTVGDGIAPGERWE